MNTQIKLSSLHNKHITEEKDKDYQVYTSHYNKTLKRLSLLEDILKGVTGNIIVNKSKQSWYEYEILVEYKGYIFNIGEDWKGKLTVYNKEIGKYSSYSIYNKERKTFEKDKKPNRYTFSKLTTKKLLQVFNYKIAYLKILKDLADNKEQTHKEIYNTDISKLTRISKALNINLQEYETINEIQTYLNTPLGRLHTTYNKYHKTTSHSYDIDKHIEYIIKVRGSC